MWVIYIMVLVAVVIGFTGLLLLQERNETICDYRYELIMRVEDAAHRDIALGREWDWRYEELEAVMYTTMVFQFWKRPQDFYPLDPARPDK